MTPRDEPVLEFLDTPLDSEHPVAWTVNDHPRPTRRHFDIHVGVEIGIVLAGASRRCYENHSFIAERGAIWFAGLWEPHGFEILKPRTRHLVLGLQPDYLAPDEPYSEDWLGLFRRPPAERPCPQSPAGRRRTLQAARRIIAILSGDDPHWLVRLRLVLHELLLGLIEQSPTPAPTSSADVARRSILPALLMVEKHPSRKITLAEAAAASHMSRSKFARDFTAAMGTPFAQYLQRRRLAGACGDLRTSDHKLLAIARRWGFADASHLVRTFKAAFAQTPQQYRDDHRTPGPARESAVIMPQVRTTPR